MNVLNSIFSATAFTTSMGADTHFKATFPPQRTTASRFRGDPHQIVDIGSESDDEGKS
jgi:hypothetical protein